MASSKISPGLRGQRQVLVCEHNVAPHVPKFSTPSMIQLMEQASMNAADIGATVTANAELLEVDRNRLTFRVEAYEGERKLGEGTHRRAIINTGE